MDTKAMQMDATNLSRPHKGPAMLYIASAVSNKCRFVGQRHSRGPAEAAGPGSSAGCLHCWPCLPQHKTTLPFITLLAHTPALGSCKRHEEGCAVSNKKVPHTCC
jgi:hypothetical protein